MLLIDDDPDFAALMQLQLGRQGYRVDHCLALPVALEREYAAILLDRNLGEVDGIGHLPQLRAMAPASPIILLTAEQSIDIVVQAIKGGAFDYIAKPPAEERLLATLHRACEFNRMASALYSDGQDEWGYGRIVGASHPMRAVYRVIANVAPTDVSVLICGSTGTGKELIAQTIHERSKRSSGPFVALNMAGLPSELVESTLFGHEKGSFSGADKRRIGACEEAEGGTLFLDEITEMPLDLQSKLLRFLQERTIRRVGGSSELPTNLRVLSATNRDPMQAVRDGKLRLDLYYRLNVVPLSLPDLCEREGDVELLVRRFLHAMSARHDRDFDSVDDEALQMLSSYEWPGNVRQLSHTIERIVVTNRGPVLRGHMVPMDCRGSSTESFETGPAARQGVQQVIRPQSAARSAAGGQPSSGHAGEALPDPRGPRGEARTLTTIEADAIRAALAQSAGSPAAAARVLGISTATIYRKLKTLNGA